VLPQGRYALPYMPFLLVWVGVGAAATILAGRQRALSSADSSAAPPHQREAGRSLSTTS
jgi:hypothetical protein